MCLVIMRNYLAAHVYLAACSSMRAYLVRLEEALAVADPEGVQGFVRTPLPRPQSLNISETKLFHFHGIYKQIDIKSAKRAPSSTELIPLPEMLRSIFQKSWIRPCLDLFLSEPPSTCTAFLFVSWDTTIDPRCVRAANALARLCVCTGSSELSMFA